MKKLMALGLAVFLGACAAQNDDTGTGSQEVNAAPTGLPSQTASLESCQGRKECQDAMVLRAVFSSDAVVTNGYEEEGDVKPLLRETMAKWLAKTNDARMSIDAKAGADGSWEVQINLAAGHETKKDEGDAEGLIITFTLKGGAVSGVVKGMYIG